MRTHSNDFKTNLSTNGRQLDSKITYTLNGQTIELSVEELNSVTPHYKGDILKSVMKQLDVDTNVDIPIGTEINFKFGIKIDKYYQTTDITYQANKDYYKYLNDEYVLLAAGTDYSVGDTITGTIYNFQEYEYLDYGNYIVNKSERQEDLGSYLLTCYDKMLYSMVDYEETMQYEATEDITFIDDKIYYNQDHSLYEGNRTGNPSELDLYECIPMSIRSFINAICTHLGITFANASDTFVNYDKVLTRELFIASDGSSLGYKYRDVLDQLAQVTASTICINENNQLEIRYITETNDTIDEDFFKNINVNFGQKYGPINSIVLSRSADADLIYQKDNASILQNGLCELKILDNQIMNDNNRDEYLSDIFNELNGLEYYINDYSSIGILYYEICDRYTAHIDNNNYSCVMFNDEVLITQGIEENVYTEMPQTSQSEYSKGDTTDRKINQAYIMVDKVNGEIESLVSKTQEIDTTVGNNYDELKNKFNDYTPVSRTAQLETSVQTLQTDTYTKTEINTKLIDGSVTKVHTVSGTFDENGMTYEKTDAPTKTTINEVGINTKRTNNNETVLFAGYVDDNNTQYADFKGQTIVATENIMVENYMIVGQHSRFEDYETGTGCFFIG